MSKRIAVKPEPDGTFSVHEVYTFNGETLESWTELKSFMREKSAKAFALKKKKALAIAEHIEEEKKQFYKDNPPYLV